MSVHETIPTNEPVMISEHPPILEVTNQALVMGEGVVDKVACKWAVLIGIESYQGSERSVSTPRHDRLGKEIQYKTLWGSVNDVLAVEEYLVHTMKLDPTHITKLLAPVPGRSYLCSLEEGSYREATYANIVEALKVPKGAKKGDFVYIHYSGHGARATTVFPELKDKGAGDLDEALVPSDICQGGQYLRDLEMGVLLQAMVDAGLIVTTVLDCCHAGGAVRGEGHACLGETRNIAEVYKSDLERDKPQNMFEIMHWGRQLSWLRAPQGFVVLAACEQHQLANEILLTDQYNHGLLTYSLVTTLRTSPADLTSQALYEKLCAMVQNSRRDQTPYLIGDRERFFFSDKLRSRVYTLTVHQVDADSSKDLRDCAVYLSGGRLHGVVEGSEYAILPWTFDLGKRIKEGDVLARVTVVRVMTGESLASFVQLADEGFDRIVEGCHAVLEKLPIVKRCTVSFDHPDKRRRESFRDAWHRHNGDRTWLFLNEEKDNSNHSFFTIDINDQGNFRIRDRPGNFISALEKALQMLPAGQDAESMPLLIRRLEHLARFQMTKTLANPGVRPGTPSALISIQVDAPTGEIIECGAAGTYELSETTVFRITIQNTSSQDLGCVILNCGAEFGIEQLYPAREPYCRLHPGESTHAHFRVQIVPELQSSAEDIIDIFKVFACAPPRNLDSLQLSDVKVMEETRLRSGDGEAFSGLDDLLNDLDATRKGILVPDPDARDIDWETVDIRIRVKPRRVLRNFMQLHS